MLRLYQKLNLRQKMCELLVEGQVSLRLRCIHSCLGSLERQVTGWEPGLAAGCWLLLVMVRFILLA